MCCFGVEGVEGNKIFFFVNLHKVIFQQKQENINFM